MTKRARIAIIGAGSWAAENHIPVLRRNIDAELVGICAVEPEQLRKVQDVFNIPFATEHYQELLDHCRPTGVIISSPHVDHYKHARAAIERGCHVMVEKPFTTDGRQARELLRLEEAHGVTIVIPFGWNFSEIANAALKFVQSAVVGDVRHLILQMATPVTELFSGRLPPATQGHLLQPNPSTWADPSRAGGYGWGQLCHALGLLFLLLEDSPERVYAITGNSVTGVDLFDAATIRFRSGATAALSGSGGLAPHARTQVDLRLFGTKGQLCLDTERARVDVDTFNGESLRAPITGEGGDYNCVRPVNFFVDVCLGRASANPASALIGCRSTEVLDALYRSAHSGNPEDIHAS